MKLFVDTCDVEVISELAETGIIDGVTTNPSIIAKFGGSFIYTVKRICEAIKGPVSTQVTGQTSIEMVEEGKKLGRIADNIVVKLPLTYEGIKACYSLSKEGLKTNVTLCFSAAQALIAARAGAAYVSPFIGRLEDCGQDGMQLICDIYEIFSNYPEINTQILAASIRDINHVVEAAKIGADVATLPPKLIKQMLYHPLTEKGMEIFMADWKGMNNGN